MPALNLTNTELLALAEDEKINTQYWARIMHDTRANRVFFDNSHTLFQSHRFNVELAVKAGITITLGVGLFLATPATLLFGAALALAVSSIVYSQINLPTHKTVLSKNPEQKIENFNEKAWDEYRTKWATQARNYGLSENQKAMHINMRRIGLALVIGFALFTAISSGAAVPLAIASVLFSSTLFHRGIDDSSPYLEDDKALPALTMS